MSTALIVFAKAPVAGLAKTRLIPALGAQGAAALAERLLEHTMTAAAAAAFERLELCAAPDAAAHRAFARLAREHGALLTDQGDGDLGERMNRALNRALQAGGHAVLIGTDAPSLDATTLRAAAAALRDHDAVFVPALDGGYALVGLARPAPDLFAGIGWSTPSVMADTRDRLLAGGLRWTELDAVPDIDEPGDLRHLPAQWGAVATQDRPSAHGRAPPGERSNDR